MTYKTAKISFHPNYILIPVNQAENREEWNKEYINCIKKHYHKLDRTPSGGISIKRNLIRLPGYSATVNNNLGIELVVGDERGWFRLQWRPCTGKGTSKVNGRHGFLKIQRELKKDKIILEDYIINNGWDVKQTIEQPIIKVLNENNINKTLTNIHHLDINSSYPAGLADLYPEMKPTLERIYNNRKLDESLKLSLDVSIGYMQSKYCKFKYSHISKHAIELNNKKVNTMLKLLLEQGRIPILVNVDGIWYQGDSMNIHETTLGGWKEDHTNCTLRIKSPGCYEFMEDNKYHPVVRGRTKLDKIKDRDNWEWGDIYQNESSQIISYIFEENKGVVENYETQLD